MKKLPTGTKSYIEDAMEIRKLQGYEYQDPPNEEVLNETSTNHLMMIMKAGYNTTNVHFFKGKGELGILGQTKERFEPVWREFSALRNIIAHHNKYPSEALRDRWLSALSVMEQNLDYAENSFDEEE